MSRFGKNILFVIIIYALMAVPAGADKWLNASKNETTPSTSPSKLADSGVWQAGVGEGFRAGATVLGLNAGAMYGMLMFGSNERHHLALGSLSYGRTIGGVRGANRWYGGNWELRGELFGAVQVEPNTSWVIGIAPHIRYHFITGARWVPFIDVGAGISWTDISVPDLGGSFQFNLQAGAGLNWFVKDDLAVSIECRYLHLSSSAISMPNNGVNTLGGLVGLNWFY
ncbi:MAG: hypothetical protein CSYNP_02304 [Syntrophus sp. SKADARSKE-3]|nr:hypothetical protein [Syntrophus sp. SKADARSKE-3]